MANEQLNDYIQKARQSGLSDEQIKSELVKAGWQEQQIVEAFQPSVPAHSIQKKKAPILTIAIIVLAVLIISGAVYAAYKFFVSTENVISTTEESMPAGNQIDSKKNINSTNSQHRYPGDYVLRADEIPAEFRLATIADFRELGEGEWLEEMGVTEIPGLATNPEPALYYGADRSKIKALNFASYRSEYKEFIFLFSIQFMSSEDLASETNKMIAEIDEDMAFLVGSDRLIIVAIDPEETFLRNIQKEILQKMGARLDMEKLESDSIADVPEELAQVGRCYDSSMEFFTRLRDSKAQREEREIVSDFDYAYSKALSRCVTEVKITSSFGETYEIHTNSGPHVFYYNPDEVFLREYAKGNDMTMDEARATFGGLESLEAYQQEKERLFH
jgi:hypothetical protein